MIPIPVHLYPTADGCLEPAAVMEQVREWLSDGKSVTIASRNRPAVQEHEGRSALQWKPMIGECWESVIDAGSDHVIIADLDLTDPDGQELVSRQESPERPPRIVPAARFEQLLVRLTERATGVLLVLSHTDISAAWQTRLKEWGVRVHWEEAASVPWRTWQLSLGEDPPALSRILSEEAELTAKVHSPPSHLLLSLVSEFSDVHYGGRKPDVDPVLVLNRVLAGQSLGYRIERIEELRANLENLSEMVDTHYRHLLKAHKATGGESKRVRAESSRQVLQGPDTGWVLH